MARPKTENPCEQVVSFRVNDETYEELQKKAGKMKLSTYMRNKVENEVSANV